MGIYNCTNWLQYFRVFALKVLLFLLFFVGGLVDLYAQFYLSQVERVERILVGPVGFSHLKYANRAVQGAEAVAEMAKRVSQAYRNPYFYYSPQTKQVYQNQVYQHTDRLEVRLAEEVRDAGEEAIEVVLAKIRRADTEGVLRNVSDRSITDARNVLRKPHPRLAESPEALRAVIDIRAHRNFKAFGLTDELVGKISSTVNTEGYAQILTNLKTLIDKFDPKRVSGLNELVKHLGRQELSFREGAEWTLRYLADHTDEFTRASAISFEVAEILPNGKRRIVDMVVEYPDLAPVYYEFKSVKSLPPNDFVEQFSKDLSRDDFSVENLRWVFDGRKIQAEDLKRLKPTLRTIIQENSIDKFGFSDEALVKLLLEQVFIVK